MRKHNVDEFGIYDAPDLMKERTVEARERVEAEPVPRRERAVEREVVATRDIDSDN